MPKRAVGLTDAAVSRVKVAKGKRSYFSDWPISPLIARVSGPSDRNPDGHVAWISRPRIKGSQERLTHGSYPAMKLERARQLAKDTAQAIADGKDLATVRAIACGQVLVGGSPPRPIDTVSAVVDQFIVRYLEQRNRAPNYIANTKGLFKNHVLPKWRERDITTISRREVVELLDEVTDRAGPTAANRTLSAISKMMRWAMQRGILESAPVIGVEKPGNEGKRDRVLDDREIALVWRCAMQLGYPWGRYFQVLLLLGQRRDATAGMRWSDLDFKVTPALWTQAAERTKGGRVFVLPLPAAVVELITSLPRIGHNSFTTTGEAAVSGYAKAKALLDKAIAAEAAKTGEPAPAGFVLHDLRRTCATGMARIGVPRFVIARILDHADNSVTSGYDRYDQLSEKYDALTRWCDHVLALTKPKVVSLNAVTQL